MIYVRLKSFSDIYILVHPQFPKFAPQTITLYNIPMKTVYLTSVTLALISHVAAWGAVGHEAVGYIAMEFLATNAAAFVEQNHPCQI